MIQSLYSMHAQLFVNICNIWRTRSLEKCWRFNDLTGVELWLSTLVLASINVVATHLAWLLLRWANHLGMQRITRLPERFDTLCKILKPPLARKEMWLGYFVIVLVGCPMLTFWPLVLRHINVVTEANGNDSQIDCEVCHVHSNNVWSWFSVFVVLACYDICSFQSLTAVLGEG